MMNGQKIIKSI